MERKSDALDAHRIGYQLGQQHALELINKYCEFNAKDIPQVVSEVVQLQAKLARLEIKMLEAQNV